MPLFLTAEVKEPEPSSGMKVETEIEMMEANTSFGGSPESGEDYSLPRDWWSSGIKFVCRDGKVRIK